MKILTIANEKGGVGKTLLSVQFAFYCAFKFGLKVALIDLDQQANSTNSIKCNSNCAIASDIKSSALLLSDNETFRASLAQFDELLKSSNLVCFPADDVLSDIERGGQEYHQLVAYNFNQNLESLKSYFDLVVIDTNPNPDIRSNLGIAVASHLVSPLVLNKEPIDGIARLINRISVLLENNPNMVLGKGFLGMLPNMLTATSFQCKNAEELFSSADHLMMKWTDLKLSWTLQSSLLRNLLLHLILMVMQSSERSLITPLSKII